MEDVLGVIAVFMLVFMNGFFVAAEFSLVGARRTRIKQLADEGHAGARTAYHAIKHLDNYIAATQLGITLASLALGWIGEPAVAHLIEPVFHAVLPGEAAETLSHTLSIAIAFSLVTLLHIVLGELVPKSIALQRPEGTSMIVSRPTTWFLLLFRPVIHLMNGIGNAIVGLLGFEPAGEHTQVHSIEELEMLVHYSHEAGLLQSHEEQLVRNAFDFGETTVQQIMQPRVEVEALPVDITLPELLAKLKTSHYSRYPLYEEDIDHVIGILHTKEILNVLIDQPELLTDPRAKLDLRQFIRPPLIIPESGSVDMLLRRMQQIRMPFAVVIDEYGGMAGVATMEDILEELIGEVHDEFDEGQHPIIAHADRVEVDGLVSLAEISERFGEPAQDVISTTIGGYVGERLSRIPVMGDRVTFNHYDVIVVEMDGMRVAKVQFKPNLASPKKDEVNKEND